MFLLKTIQFTLRPCKQASGTTFKCRTIFSYFKKKIKPDPTKANNANEKEETHAQVMWSVANKNFTENQLSKTNISNKNYALKPSELKALKKSAFLDVIELFIRQSGKGRRGFHEFLKAALEQMETYEVADDLEVYKALLNVLPADRLKAKSFLHAELGAYKQQQDIVSQLLMQLNNHQVLPDDDVGDKIVQIFGWKSHVMTHYRRMMYWVPKLRHANPWPVLEKLPDDLADNSEYLAQLVASRICPDPNVQLTTIKVNEDELKDSTNPTCLVSAQSEIQRALLSAYTHQTGYSKENRVLYLDGPVYVWYRQLQVAYYILWVELDEKRLQTQIEIRNKKAENLDLLDEGSWEYKICGSDRDKHTRMQFLEQKIRENTSGHQVNTSFLPVTYKRNEIIKGQSESRKRAIWSNFQKVHQLTHLPEELVVQHEQAEGTILALGVVGPIESALKNQKILYEWEATKGVQSEDETFKLPERAPPTYMPIVPAPATPQLLRNWLKDLRVKNPGLDLATVAMRDRKTCLTEQTFNEDLSNQTTKD